MKAIIGKKLGMTRIFEESGAVVPVTLIVAEPNVVTQLKSEEKDGYKAVQIALPEDKKVKKPQEGHLKKAGTTGRVLKEFAADTDDFKIGDKLDVAQFAENDEVMVSGISKGKGFAGTVKRHHFKLGPKTHGSDNYRRPGSIGAQQPQRVIKGRRMAGHLGFDKVTLKSVKVQKIDPANNILMVKGSVPGPRDGFVYIWSK